MGLSVGEKLAQLGFTALGFVQLAVSGFQLLSEDLHLLCSGMQAGIGLIELLDQLLQTPVGRAQLGLQLFFLEGSFVQSATHPLKFEQEDAGARGARALADLTRAAAFRRIG